MYHDECEYSGVVGVVVVVGAHLGVCVSLTSASPLHSVYLAYQVQDTYVILHSV